MNKFEPSEDYESLKVQANALFILYKSTERQKIFWHNEFIKLSAENFKVSTDAINAERETNSRLTEELLKAEEKIEQLENLITELQLNQRESLNDYW